jgi:hypothetical protein
VAAQALSQACLGSCHIKKPRIEDHMLRKGQTWRLTRLSLSGRRQTSATLIYLIIQIAAGAIGGNFFAKITQFTLDPLRLARSATRLSAPWGGEPIGGFIVQRLDLTSGKDYRIFRSRHMPPICEFQHILPVIESPLAGSARQWLLQGNTPLCSFKICGVISSKMSPTF